MKRKHLYYGILSIVLTILETNSVFASEVSVFSDTPENNVVLAASEPGTEVNASFKVSLPSKIVLTQDEANNRFICKSKVGVSGEISDTASICVKPEFSIELHDDSGLSTDIYSDAYDYNPTPIINATAYQDYTVWHKEDLEGKFNATFVYDTETKYSKTNTSLVVYDPPAGDWTGKIKFNIGYCDGTNHKIEDGVCSICNANENGGEPDVAGLYDVNWVMVKTWQELLDENVLHNSGGILSTNYDSESGTNSSADILNGNLVINSDITKIDASAFSRCENLYGVVLPDGLSSIGKSAFYKCTNLAHINLPNSCNSIGAYAFQWCANLEQVVIPDSVTSIAKYAFSKTGLTSVKIPKDIKAINEAVFWDCSNLSRVKLEDSIETIGDSAFLNCVRLDTIEIPNSVNKIDEYAFQKCGSLKQIVLPESVTSIEKYAFSRTGLTSATVPANIKIINEGVFWDCKYLKTVTFSGDVESIGAAAFADCIRLKSITIPNSVKSLGNQAFEYCKVMTKITIPESVTSIGQNAFYLCSKLNSVTFKSMTDWYVGDSAGAKTTALSSTDLASTSTAAKYLRSTYYSKYWTK